LRTEVIHVLSKPKVSNFVDSVMNENVSWFEIPMHDFLLNELAESTNNLPDYLKSFIILEAFALYYFFEIAMLTKLSYYIQTILGAQYVFEPDNVGMIETFK
jgi:hypothetical protein